MAGRSDAAEGIRMGVPAHPLDPLSGSEIEVATQAIKTSVRFPDGAGFASIALSEPEKAVAARFLPGQPLERRAFAVIADTKRNRTFEAVVALATGKIERWSEIPNVQPQILLGEYDRYTAIVRADPRFVAALAKRGITDVSRVIIEGWAAGQFLPADTGKARLMRGLCYMKADGPNYYGRPIEGLVATVNMNTGRVVELIDEPGAPVPPNSHQLDQKSLVTAFGPARSDLKPLVMAQPEGPSFRVSGSEISWQKWRFRVAMHPREGLVLRTVSYRDDGRDRLILNRAAISEMAVPYGDPSRAWAWRNAFDQGEYGLGKMSVAVDADVPPYATTMDVTLADEEGKPYQAPRRIGVYERDGGILWRHSSDKARDVRRSRELVVMFVATVGNYDYAFHWIFRQDGSLESDVAASGIMLPKAVADSAHGGHNTVGGHSGAGEHVVDVGTAAPHHQHFFNYRLDFDVDGPSNSVLEIDAMPAPAGKNNPYGNAMSMDERLLATERAARRDLAPGLGRKWKIENAGADANRLGYHPAYVLLPGENGLPLASPGSVGRKRAPFIEHQFWVTRYRPEEMNAAGPYPTQASGEDGLLKWTADDESLRDQDLVVWYTMGLTHIPRPEEWPVMPETHLGFKLIPAGFFERNPGLDVPEGK